MSVQKFKQTEYNPLIEREAVPFTMVNTNVIKNLKNAEAGFVWIYLLSHTENWRVIKSHLKNHFDIGDNKLKQIFAYLANHRLIEYIQTTNEKGQFGKSDIRILNGDRFLNETYDDLTAGSISAPPVFRTCGSGELLKKDITKEKEKRATRQKRSPLPPHFMPSEKLLVLTTQTAENVGLTHAQLLTKFQNLMRSKGKQSADWQAEYENFLITERPSFNHNEKVVNIKSKDSTTSSAKEYGPGHPHWEAFRKMEQTHGSKASGDNIKRAGVRKVTGYIL